MQNFFTSLNDYNDLLKNKKKLGVGSFGEVYLIKSKSRGKFFAMKEITKRDDKNCDNIKKEISLHQNLRHKNIIKLIDYLETEKKVYLVLEYAEKGDLFNYLKKNEISFFEKINIFHQICLAISYLHSKDIIHRDLKPENVLIDKKGNMKICDFGWSVKYFENETRQTFCGTYEYMAPEIYLKTKQSKKIDIWALGILLYELFHGHAPFQGKNSFEVWNKVKKNVIFFKKDLDKRIKSAILKILVIDQNLRPDINQILNFDFLKEFRDVGQKKLKKIYIDPVTEKIFTNPLQINLKKNNSLCFMNIYSSKKMKLFLDKKQIEIKIEKNNTDDLKNSKIEKNHNIQTETKMQKYNSSFLKTFLDKKRTEIKIKVFNKSCEFKKDNFFDNLSILEKGSNNNIQNYKNCTFEDAPLIPNSKKLDSHSNFFFNKKIFSKSLKNLSFLQQSDLEKKEVKKYLKCRNLKNDENLKKDIKNINEDKLCKSIVFTQCNKNLLQSTLCSSVEKNKCEFNNSLFKEKKNCKSNTKFNFKNFYKNNKKKLHKLKMKFVKNLEEFSRQQKTQA